MSTGYFTVAAHSQEEAERLFYNYANYDNVGSILISDIMARDSNYEGYRIEALHEVTDPDDPVDVTYDELLESVV